MLGLKPTTSYKLITYFETSFKEHFRTIKNGEIEKSAVAEHVWKATHNGS